MFRKCISLLFVAVVLLFAAPVAADQVPIYISFHWHMHQPIYWPYENIMQTEASGGTKYSFSVVDVHTSRTGPYTSWPRNAVSLGLASNPNGGAQVSFSGSLIENLNNLAAAGRFDANWANSYREAAGWKTARNNPRLDMVAFGYHHPLMGLIDGHSIRKQIQMHRQIAESTWGVSYSKGMFPPENAFSPRMIPALAQEGIQWVMVDNIHFDRACDGYPWVKGSNLFPPNKADQRNSNPSDWLQRSGMWAPSQVSAGFGYRPHFVSYTDPATGQKYRVVAVPTARYEGNEDGRGGFGALNYESVISQLLPYNTDPAHPILVVLHHDGDNYGGGTDSYYHSNFQNFVNWVNGNPNFRWTTIQDYLDQFPPADADEIHVEDGSWAGADNGDPEFGKWNGGENASGYSYDRNSWAVITAAENRVKTADALEPSTGTTAIIAGTGNNTDKAWHNFLVGQTSCYWYWDGTENWDSHPTRAANLAMQFADQVIAAHPGQDTVAPSVYTLQRDPYNPGAYEWLTTPEQSDFQVWTFVYDVSGLASVNLKYRIHSEPVGAAHKLYAGGSWSSLTMSGVEYGTPLTDPQPAYRAKKYSVMVEGLTNTYVDYYVEAVDAKGNITRSDMYHVYVGDGGNNNGGAVTFNPAVPFIGQQVTVSYSGFLKDGAAVNLHWGYDGWKGVTDTPMAKQPDGSWTATVTVPAAATTAFDAVFNNGAGSWDNNNGADWHVNVIPWGGDDTQNPDVAITAPVNGSTVTGTVSLTATATDNVGVTRVEFYAGTNKLGEDNTAPYAASVNTLNLVNGSLLLRAVAYDAAGNSGQASVTVTVDNDIQPPSLSVAIDKGTVNISGACKATASASDNKGVTAVRFHLDGVQVLNDTTAPYEYSFNADALANGPHTLAVQAFDAAGNVAAVTQAFSVSNTTPQVERTVRYLPVSTANHFFRYKLAGNGFNAFPGEKMALAGAWRTWTKTMPAGALTVEIVTASGRRDNNGGAGYVILSNSAWIKNGQVYYNDPNNGDVTPPQVAITAPAAGTVSSTVDVAATASDNVGVVKVDFLVNGALAVADMTAPYGFSWNSTSVSNGSCILTAIAYDAAGNSATNSRTVTVQNGNPDQAPTVASVTVPSGAVSGNVTMSAVASDDKGIASVAFYVGTNLAGTDTGAPYSVLFNTTLLADGQYTVRVVATDTIGQTGENTATLQIQNGQVLTKKIHYKTAWTAAYIHYNNGSWTAAPGEQMAADGNGWFSKTVSSMGSLEFVFNNGAGTWDNNYSTNYITTLPEVWIKDHVVYPSDPENNTNSVAVTVHYKTSWTTVNMHYNGGSGWTTAPGVQMDGYRASWYRKTVNRTAASLTFVFNNGTLWDNNNEANYTSTLTQLWVRNGQVLASDPEPDITDTEAPVVASLTPVSGTTCSNTVVLAADATDNVGVTRVEFLVNGSVAGTDTTAPYSFSWNSRSVANGSVTIQARAFDAAGNSAVTALATLTVANSGNNDNPWPGSWSGKLGATVYSDGVEFAVWWRNSVVSGVSVPGSFNGWSATATPMTRVGTGDDADVWYVFVPGAGPGAEYRFAGTLAGTTNRVWVADVYAKYNRYSNGNSVVVDNTFNWTATGWQRPDWNNYIIYELHVKDFTSADTTVTAAHRGKYLGVIEKLPYLKQLGITAIELMPISEFSDVGYSWGYNTSLFGAPESGYAVNPAAGQEGVDQLKQLIDACHANGIAVIFDMVFNHVSNGDNHFWQMDKVAWFDFNNNGNPADDQTPWGNKFNTRHPRVHKYAKDVCEYFMREFKVDGFRLDATHTDFMDHDFVRGLKAHLSSIDSKVFFTMENLPNQSDLKTWGSQWAAEYRHRGKDILCGWNGIDATYFSKHIYYTADHGWSGSPVETLNYLESHDEDTLKYLFNIAGISVEGAKWKTRLGAVMLSTSLGVPMVWMGQEFLRAREGQNTDELPLDWSLKTTNQDIVDYYGAVMRLRRDNPSLRLSNPAGFTWQYTPWTGDNNVVGYSLWTGNAGDKKFTVLLNFNSSSRTVNLGFPANGTWTKVITETAGGGTGTINVSGNSASVTIQGSSGIVFMQ